jgi:hypothetical protein
MPNKWGWWHHTTFNAGHSYWYQNRKNVFSYLFKLLRIKTRIIAEWVFNIKYSTNTNTPIST